MKQIVKPKMAAPKEAVELPQCQRCGKEFVDRNKLKKHKKRGCNPNDILNKALQTLKVYSHIYGKATMLLPAAEVYVGNRRVA